MNALGFALVVGIALVMVSSGTAVGEIRHKLAVVGSTGLMVGSQTSDVDVDPARNVAYVGSYVDLGTAVVDITDRSRPTVVKLLSTDYVGANDRTNSSDSADVDMRGNLLALANQAFNEGGFGGVSLRSEERRVGKECRL